MRKLCDHVRYYSSLIANNSYKLLLRVMTALSFIAIILTFLYVCYYLFMDFCYYKVLAGAVALLIDIHLNKSLQ